VIRFAKKEDRFVMAELVLVILKDMELPFVKEIGEAKTLEILADAMLEPDYRYGFRRALVNEIDGEVAGVAFGYPDKEEATIDQPLDKVLEQYGLSKDMKLFIDEETLPNEWYLDTICVAEKFPHAKRLYEKHGFEVVAQREISGHLYDHMQKRTS